MMQLKVIHPVTKEHCQPTLIALLTAFCKQLRAEPFYWGRAQDSANSRLVKQKEGGGEVGQSKRINAHADDTSLKPKEQKTCTSPEITQQLNEKPRKLLFIL